MPLKEAIVKVLLRIFSVKSILSMGVLAVYMVLSFNGSIEAKDVMIITIIVFNAYFDYQKNKTGGDK